jgi:hypothetical protein
MKLFCVVIVTFLFAICEARYKCQPVCPNWSYDPDKLAKENVGKYFEVENGPDENGVCPVGQKYVFDGSQYGYTGLKRCVCVINRKSNFSFACKSIADKNECPEMLTTTLDKTSREYYKSYASVANRFPEDGCCAKGSTRYIIEPEELGLNRTLCFCVAPFAKVD